MSYIDVLNDAAARADAASTKAESASQLLEDIVNGPTDTFVTTLNGQVPTAATAIEDLRDQITAGTTAPILESVTLGTNGQTNVSFTNIQTSGIAVYIDEAGSSTGSYRYFNFTVDGTSSIILNDSFNSGTVVHGMSQEIGGQIETAVDQTQANAQLAEDWAILTGTTVDGTEFSAKHYSQQSSASASNAATSETNAANSAAASATSATLSEDWATLTGQTVDGTEFSAKHYSQEASTSASNAATSETNAATSASNAATSETNAATSASNAATSETNAATSETNAANSAAAAASSYDQFDDRYLGSKSSDPATDNDGNALITGATYWSTVTNNLKFYNGTAWEGVVEAHVNDADPHTQYMESVNNLSDLTNTSTARENLSVVQRTSLTGSAVLPSGTEAQRDPTPAAGYIRFNSDIGLFEGYNGSGWVPVGSGATGAAGDQVFVENDKVVTSNYTIPSDKNASTTGPITIQDGVTVTVSDGSRWVII